MNELDRVLAYAARRMEEVGRSMYRPLAPLACRAYLHGQPTGFAERMQGEELELTPGMSWRREGAAQAWLCLTGELPRDIAQQPAARLDVGGYALVIDGEGMPVCSAGGHTSPDAGAVLLSAQPGDAVELWVECRAEDGDGVLGNCELCALQPGLRRLYFDCEVLMDLARQPDVGAARRGMIVRALQRAMQVLTDMSDERAMGAAYALAGELERSCGDYGFALSAVGQADMALLREGAAGEGLRRAAGAFADALHGMDAHDAMVFGAGQPLVYEWIKTMAPGLYDRVRERVSQGRWELQGGTWVQPDMSMSGGESLARQILYGKRFYAREFGQDVSTMWLPDAWGCCAQLPQLMVKSGMQYLLAGGALRAQSWLFPYSSFHWQGLDGSRVMAHVPPEGTAQSSALPGSALAAERGFMEMGMADGALMLHGPERGCTERLDREQGLMGMPPVRRERSVDFFDRLRRSRVELPAWSGELFAEGGQGAYTAQLAVRQANRRMESALRQGELILTAMYLRGAEYPRAGLRDIWKHALLNQSVGALSGMASRGAYEALLAGSRELERDVAALAARCWSGDSGIDVVLNPHAWTMDMWLRDRTGCEEGEALRVSLPPMSASSTVGARKVELPAMTAADGTLENDRLRVLFDERGCIAGITDKRQGWEVLRGAGNRMSVYEDDGDGRSIGEDMLRQKLGAFEQQSVTYEREGAVCRRTAVYAFGSSTVTQTVELRAGSARMDFITRIDWQERGRLLRAEFPLNVVGGRFLCDVQFGHVERPAHRNTAREQGMFEVNALKWADLSQTGRGAALMLDGGYGHACLDNLLSISLVRTPGGAAEDFDKGVHELRYALYPHGGDLCDVVRQAYAIHQPPVECSGATFGPLCWLDVRNVIIDAVKVAEDSGDVVLRMYECSGASCSARLRTGFAMIAASVCDLMERVTAPLTVEGEEIALEFAPFEIKSVIITPQRQ